MKNYITLFCGITLYLISTSISAQSAQVERLLYEIPVLITPSGEELSSHRKISGNQNHWYSIKPFIFLNGLLVPDEDIFTFGTRIITAEDLIAELPLEKVRKVDFVKPAEALVLYGQQAQFGVIRITAKRSEIERKIRHYWKKQSKKTV
ncbi:hypothetical protein EJV47_15675 [Hymenobacter gummosus]|uniref:TonB-dependent receptor plug domain-containing protein n=1 Tax=Hymenobacter gummosus TaxID=1776032 RepID=A0A3S0K414_9BACT|nr:hypothetical protein [Hymenobacter gummosus]RTQ48411.1 hypothetical protein EJV47_15675 [Hymenobacter gummosus]